MSLVNFLKEAIELTNQIAEFTGKVEGKRSSPGQPQGYVIKTGGGSSPVKRLLSNTRRAELTLNVNLEPITGEPVHFSLSAQLRRGGSNDPGGKNR